MSQTTRCGAKVMASLIVSLACMISGSSWAAGDEEEAAEKEYAAFAAANDDALSWLGPLPANWSDADVETWASALVRGIEEDLDTGSRSQEPSHFKCRSPGEVGPVPNLEAVNDYLMNFPQSARDQKIIGNLYAAGKAGNWLAILQIYMVETQTRTTPNEMVRMIRVFQLMEWLRARKVGGLYQQVGPRLPRARFFENDAPGGVDSINLYAAMHDSYPAQHDVGKRLMLSPSADLRDIGQRMIACAKAALPGYARLLKD